MSKLQDLFLSRMDKKATPTTIAGKVVSEVSDVIKSNGGYIVDSEATSSFISMENLSSSQEAHLRDATASLENVIGQVVSLEGLRELDTITSTGSVNKGINNNQIVSAMFAGMLSANPQGTMNMKVSKPSLESHQTVIDVSGQGSFLGERINAALESYDERDNRHTTAYSIAYNLISSRQDEFGETFFPTVVVSPDQYGFTVSIRVTSVINDYRREISGKLADINRQNVIRAVVDHTILEDESTKVVPVRSANSQDNFAQEVAPFTTVVAGETINTGYLAFDKSVDLIGISQTQALLDTGVLDSTDTLDSHIKLDSVALLLDGEAIRIKTSAIPLSTFTHRTQGAHRTMGLNFDPQYITIRNVPRLADGTGLSTKLEDLGEGKTFEGYSIRIKTSVYGSVNQSTGETSLTAKEVEVVTVFDEDGNDIGISSGAGQTLAAIFADAKLVGYTLDARRSNLNRRQRGKLVENNYYQQIYTVPLHSPITSLRPVTITDQTDAADLTSLITTTRVRTSNAAVTKLIDAANTLRDFADNTDTVYQNPEMFGIANWLVKAYFREESIDIEGIVDSVKSSERMEDLQAAIVSKIRHFAYTAYRDSEYQAAADAHYGGVSPKPTVIIGTDPLIANYLMVTGDFRTLGNEFEVKIVSTLDQRVKNKIYVTFGTFGDSTEGQPNPLHFGNMAWKPELTLVLPMSRNGQISKELTVQPSFVHIQNLPVLGVFDVEGIEKVINEKVAIRSDG